MKRPSTVRAEAAVQHLEEADKLAARAPLDRFEGLWNPPEAVRLRTKGEALLTRPSELHGDPSLEVMAALEPGEPVSNELFSLRDTLQQPDVISVDASSQRSSLALRAGVLTNALDAAKSAGATSAIEKMIAHQIAACHDAGMNLLIRLHDAAFAGSHQLQQPGEIARLTNATSRLFEVCQNGALVLQKLKTGGTQRVLVQHQQLVQVGAGGQAVVTKTVRRARGPRGRDRKNGR